MRIHVTGHGIIQHVDGVHFPAKVRPQEINDIFAKVEGEVGAKRWTVKWEVNTRECTAKLFLREAAITVFPTSELSRREPVVFEGATIEECFRSAFTAIRMGVI